MNRWTVEHHAVRLARRATHQLRSARPVTDAEARQVIDRVLDLVLDSMRHGYREPSAEPEVMQPRLPSRAPFLVLPPATPEAVLRVALVEAADDLRRLAMRPTVEALCRAVRSRGGHLADWKLRALAREAIGLPPS